MQRQSSSSRDEPYRFTEGMIHCNTDNDGRIVYINQRFAIVTGYEKEELIGKPCEKLFSAVNPKEILQEIQKRLAERERWEGILRFLRKDGRHLWAFTQVTPLVQGDRQTGIAYVGRPAAPGDIAERELEFKAKTIQEKARI